MNAKLYIVATPIGNLSDISQRAIEVLKNVDYVLCEDTRVTKKLLDKYKIEAKLISYRQHSIKNSRKLEQIERLISAGNQLALVTDAGTPGVSDPGNELIEFLLSRFPSSNILEGSLTLPARNFHLIEPVVKLQIIPIPGPSAVASAISVCGFDMSRYAFIGFIPKKKREKMINSLDWNYPVVCFDSPYRLVKNLELIKNTVGDRQIYIGRELTKLHEEHFRGKISDVLEQLGASKIRGEVVIIVGVPRKN